MNKNILGIESNVFNDEKEEKELKLGIDSGVMTRDNTSNLLHNEGKVIGANAKVMDGPGKDTKYNSGTKTGNDADVMNGPGKDTKSNSGIKIGKDAKVMSGSNTLDTIANSGIKIGKDAKVMDGRGANTKSNSGIKVGSDAKVMDGSNTLDTIANSGIAFGSDAKVMDGSNTLDTIANSGIKIGKDAKVMDGSNTLDTIANSGITSGYDIGKDLITKSTGNAINNDAIESDNKTKTDTFATYKQIGPTDILYKDSKPSNIKYKTRTNLINTKTQAEIDAEKIANSNKIPEDENSDTISTEINNTLVGFNKPELHVPNPSSNWSGSDTKKLLYANNIFDRASIKWYNRFNRLGCLDPYNVVTTTKEYLFFTKPDLHLVTPRSGGNLQLNPELTSNTFFVELSNRYPSIITQLQSSVYSRKTSGYYPFMNILSNSVKNTLDLPAITTTDIDTSANIYGTSIEYRGVGWTSDEKVDFSLEFEDTKYLEIYHLLKAYEEYERMKKLGMVTPPNVDGAESSNGYNFNRYIRNKELHDQFGIYKFIVDEDFSTILYYAYLTGVYFKNVPRDAFTDMRDNGTLKYNVEFKAQFVDDMNPAILYDFNHLISNNMKRGSTRLEIYNDSLYNDGNKTRGGIDGRWAKNPYVIQVLKNDGNNSAIWLSPNDMKYKYKLIWEV